MGGMRGKSGGSVTQAPRSKSAPAPLMAADKDLNRLPYDFIRQIALVHLWWQHQTTMF